MGSRSPVWPKHTIFSLSTGTEERGQAGTIEPRWSQWPWHPLGDGSENLSAQKNRRSLRWTRDLLRWVSSIFLKYLSHTRKYDTQRHVFIIIWYIPSVFWNNPKVGSFDVGPCECLIQDKKWSQGGSSPTQFFSLALDHSGRKRGAMSWAARQDCLVFPASSFSPWQIYCRKSYCERSVVRPKRCHDVCEASSLPFSMVSTHNWVRWRASTDMNIY